MFGLLAFSNDFDNFFPLSALHFIPLLTGVLVGGLLIWLLMVAEDRLHAKCAFVADHCCSSNCWLLIAC
jgi:hypothetical protein